MDKGKKSVFGTRQFVKFDEHTDLGLILDTSYPFQGTFDIMVHPCSDDPSGVIVWFEFNGVPKTFKFDDKEK